MKKLIAIAVVLGFASGAMAAKKAEPVKAEPVKVSEPAKPAISATCTFEIKDNRLYCYVALNGVAKGDKVEPVIKSTPPESAQLFVADSYRSRMVRTQTKCYRTIVTTVGDKEYRATGVWKFKVVVDGVVIGEGSYEVK
jgi:hypothetical protein